MVAQNGYPTLGGPLAHDSFYEAVVDAEPLDRCPRSRLDSARADH